jgi:hypothetical protein
LQKLSFDIIIIFTSRQKKTTERGIGLMFDSNPHASQKISRRNLLEVGALSALGVSLPNILRADQNTKPIKAKSCIFIYQYGGCLLYTSDAADD